MKHLGKFFLAIVALSLLSSGISSAAFAAAEPISVTTNKEWYAEGSTIIISGLVKDFDASDDMKSFDVSSLFYEEVIKLICLKDYELAIKSIRKYINTLKSPDDIALAYLNCGFLNDKLGDNISAIEDFSRAISLEEELQIITK